MIIITMFYVNITQTHTHTHTRMGRTRLFELHKSNYNSSYTNNFHDDDDDNNDDDGDDENDHDDMTIEAIRRGSHEDSLSDTGIYSTWQPDQQKPQIQTEIEIEIGRAQKAGTYPGQWRSHAQCGPPEPAWRRRPRCSTRRKPSWCNPRAKPPRGTSRMPAKGVS